MMRRGAVPELLLDFEDLARLGLQVPWPNYHDGVVQRTPEVPVIILL